MKKQSAMMSSEVVLLHADSSLPKRFIFLFYSLLTLAIVSHAAVEIVEPPGKEIFVRAGQKGVIVWNYTVDDRDSELDLIAFKWLVAVPPYSSTKKVIKEELRGGTRRDGANIPNFLKNRADVKGRATLEITNVSQNDSNTYFFEVDTTAFGTLSFSVNLTVTVPPVAKVSEMCVIAGIDESKTVTCEASGVPTPNITWTRWGNKKPLFAATIAVFGGSYSNLTFNGDLAKVAEYVCTARLPTGEESSASVYFNVEYISASTSTTINCNERVCCPASGFPQPIYHWIFPNGTLLTTDTSKCLSKGSVKGGKYECRASNSKGVSRNNVTVCPGTQTIQQQLIPDSRKVNISWVGQVGYDYDTYHIVAKEGNIICYVSAGEAPETVLEYNNLDRCKTGNAFDLEVIVWGERSETFEKVAQGIVPIGPTSSAAKSHQVGFIQLIASLTVFFLTVLFQ